MAYERNDYAGAAAATTLAAGINGSDTSISITASTGWPAGSNGAFVAVIDEGTASEEKVLVTTRTGTTLNTVTRGYDGTSAASHSSGAAIAHCIAAVDLDEANYWVAELAGAAAAANDLIIADGDNSLSRIAKGSSSTVLAVDSGGTLGYTTVTSAMITDATIAAGDLADSAVTTAKINDAAVTSAKLAAAVAGDGLAGGAGSALSVNVDASTIEIATDTLQVKDAGITAAKLAAAVAGNGLAGGAGSALSVNVDGSTLEINTDALRVKAAGIGLSHISLASNPSSDTDAARKAYVDLLEQKAKKTSTTDTTYAAGTTAGTAELGSVTITDPGYDIWVEGHASVAAYSSGQTATWAVWSAIIKVDGTIVDRIDIPHSIALQGAAGISFAVPLRRTLKSTGSNTTVTFHLTRQSGDGDMTVGGDGTTQVLQVYYGRQ